MLAILLIHVETLWEDAAVFLRVRAEPRASFYEHTEDRVEVLTETYAEGRVERECLVKGKIRVYTTIDTDVYIIGKFRVVNRLLCISCSTCTNK